MADYRSNRVALSQCGNKLIEHFVLRCFKVALITTFQFDADREIVATLATLPTRDSRVPGTAVTRYELYQLSIAANEKMRRNLESLNLLIIGMLARIERLGKQRLDTVATKLARREADGMNYQQRNYLPCWPLIAIRR